MKDEYAAEADTIEDVLDADNPVIDRIIEQEQTERKQELIAQMRTAINRADSLTNSPSTISANSQTPILPAPSLPQPQSQTPLQPIVNQQFQNLANNNTFSIQTIAQQANRIQQTFQPQPQPQLQYPPQTSQFQPQPYSQSQYQTPPFYPPTTLAATPSSVPPQPTTPPDLYSPPTAIFSSH